MFDLPIKLFVDCVDIATIARQAERPEIAGFTTNPTLMRRAGIQKYEPWAKSAIISANGKPISFEVLADDFDQMERQARIIGRWGENVYVKIPITDTKGNSTVEVIRFVTKAKIKVNVTAVMTEDQHQIACDALVGTEGGIVSVFAGRIADTGLDLFNFQWPVCPPRVERLWASPRQIYDTVAAYRLGFAIITLTPEILSKLPFYGKSLTELSLETVQQFYTDAVAAGYSL